MGEMIQAFIKKSLNQREPANFVIQNLVMSVLRIFSYESEGRVINWVWRFEAGSSIHTVCLDYNPIIQIVSKTYYSL